MRKLLFLLLLISYTSWSQAPQRALYGTKEEVRNYADLARVFIVPNFGTRTMEVFMTDDNDLESPESDSVIVPTVGSKRLKRLLPTAAESLVGAWSDITGKPSTFPPSSHTQAISTVVGLQDSLNTRQKTLTLGSVLQYRRGDNSLATLSKSSVFLDSVQNYNQTNAANLLSGTIPSGRFGTRTIAPAAISTTGATNGQVLKYSSSLNAYVPKNDSLGSGGSATWGGLSGTLSSQTDLQTALDAKAPTSRTITAGTGLTGGGNLSADRTLSIANDGVTNTKMASMPNNTIKGNISGSTANPSDVSVLSLPVSTATQTAINTRIAFKTISELKAFTATDVTNNPTVFITDSGKEGEFRYVSGSSATDNVGRVIVTTSGGYRYIRVIEGNTYNAAWYDGYAGTDPHKGTRLRLAIADAIASLSAGDSSATVIIPKGRNTIDTTSLLTAVPKWKRLVIQGEPGNVIDFYNPESGAAVFSNSASWTYADSSYSGGAVELRNLNFYGGRNPVYTAGNASYGSRPILYRNMQSVIIDGCTFRSIYGSGLAIGASRTVIVRGNRFENVYARQSNSPDATGDAISIYAYVRNLVVSGNIAQVQNGLTGRCGISVDDRTRNFVVSDNIIQGYERGIHVEHCLAGVINGNVVTRAAFAGLSSINRGVTWSNNIFDGDKQTAADLLGYPGLFTALNDTLCTYRGNTMRNWSGRSNTYLAKFWGNDLLIDGNTFEPNRSSAEVYGYGYNYRNTFSNNRFMGGTILRLDYTYFSVADNNTFYGGTIYTHNSEDAMVTNNKLFPDYKAGNNTGAGLLIYNCTRPYVSGNIITNAASYAIEQSSTTDGVFESNTLFKKHSSGTLTFFVSTGISATGAKKTAPDRYNVIRDFVGGATKYVGNTGTPTDY